MMRIVLIVLVTKIVCAKNLTRCELTKELLYHDFPRDQLENWVCLVEAESSRRTDVIGGPDDDGSYDYGLFQINNRYWCSNGSSPGKDCNVRCKDLLSDDLTKASLCTKYIYTQQGFDAWLGWVNECKDKDLPDLSNCH